MDRIHPGARDNILLIVTVLIMLSACRSAPVYTANDVSISPNASASEEEIAEVIWSAARRLGWQTKKVGEWKIKAVKQIRNHSLTVSIPYSKNAFSIIYVDSENLDYDGQTIHVNYNVWVSRLEQRIQKEIEFRLPEMWENK